MRRQVGLRTIGAVTAGAVTFEALVLLSLFAARAGWPAYAAAEPSRAFSFTMLLVRLAVAALITLVAGAVAARVDQSTKRAALMFGLALLALSVVWHIRIWYQYPVWYHLCWLACIVPFSVLGGSLVRRAGPR